MLSHVSKVFWLPGSFHIAGGGMFEVQQDGSFFPVTSGIFCFHVLGEVWQFSNEW